MSNSNPIHDALNSWLKATAPALVEEKECQVCFHPRAHHDREEGCQCELGDRPDATYTYSVAGGPCGCMAPDLDEPHDSDCSGWGGERCDCKTHSDWEWSERQ